MSNHNLASTLKPRKWRTRETHERYERERQADLKHTDLCPLCEAETIESFTYWRTIPNKYPYDAVAKRHDQLVPLRHTAGTDLTPEELVELVELKRGALNETYFYIMEALPGTKSIPGHFHLHLLVPKPID